MKYYSEQMKIRRAYLQSRLELELSKLNDIEDAMEAVKKEIVEVHDENMELILENQTLKCEEYPVDKVNPIESHKISKICTQMDMFLKLANDDRDRFKQQLNIISESYSNIIQNIIDTTESQKSYEHYCDLIKKTYESVEAKSQEIAEYNNYIKRKKNEWMEQLRVKEDLFDLLCEIDKEQKQSIKNNLRNRNECEMEIDEGNKKTLSPISTENQLLIVMEKLKALSKLKIADD